MIPFGPKAAISLAGRSNFTISEKTWHSRIRRAMTWVYCEPKSRMTMREAAGAAMLVADAGILANQRIFGFVRLHEAAALDWAATLDRGIGGDITLATAKQEAGK